MSEDIVFTADALMRIARGLFKSGAEDEARQVLTAAHLLSRLPKPMATRGVAVAAVTSPEDWAARNGFALTRHTYPAPWLDTLYLDPDLSPLWRQEAVRFAMTHTGETATVTAAQATILAVPWGLAGGKVDEQYSVLAPNGDLFCEDDYWMRWLDNALCFRAYAADRRRFLLDLVAAADDGALPDDRPLMLIGSKTNWSHWLIDFVSRLKFWHDHPERDRIRLVMGRLNGGQRKTLAYFGVDPDQVIQLRAEPNRVALTRACQLTVTQTPPKPMAFDFVRAGFAARPRDGRDGPKRVYISRRNMYPRHRVANEDQVAEFLAGRGFTVVCIETLPFEAQLDMLADAEVIVLSFGGDIGNLAMCNPAATVVMLASAAYAERTERELMRREIIRFVFGSGLPTVPVYGAPLKPDDAGLDVPALYDLATLGQAVDRALDLAAARRR